MQDLGAALKLYCDLLFKMVLLSFRKTRTGLQKKKKGRLIIVLIAICLLVVCLLINEIQI